MILPNIWKNTSKCSKAPTRWSMRISYTLLQFPIAMTLYVTVMSPGQLHRWISDRPATEQPCAGHILWQGRLVRFAATENCKQENMRIMRTNVTLSSIYKSICTYMRFWWYHDIIWHNDIKQEHYWTVLSGKTILPLFSGCNSAKARGMASAQLNLYIYIHIYIHVVIWHYLSRGVWKGIQSSHDSKTHQRTLQRTLVVPDVCSFQMDHIEKTMRKLLARSICFWTKLPVIIKCSL